LYDINGVVYREFRICRKRFRKKIRFKYTYDIPKVLEIICKKLFTQVSRVVIDGEPSVDGNEMLKIVKHSFQNEQSQCYG
jgi:hypothetical protein